MTVPTTVRIDMLKQSKMAISKMPRLMENP
jgi:hypothetical protein